MIFTSAPWASPAASCTCSATCADRRRRPSTGWAPALASSPGAQPRAAGRSRRATHSSAPWTTGAACLVHEGRFDARRRMEMLAEQGVNVLCQSPTEYRMIAARPGLYVDRVPGASPARVGR